MASPSRNIRNVAPANQLVDRTIAYAAGTAISSVRTTHANVTITVFTRYRTNPVSSTPAAQFGRVTVPPEWTASSRTRRTSR
jgi:hypothetical protein